MESITSIFISLEKKFDTHLFQLTAQSSILQDQQGRLEKLLTKHYSAAEVVQQKRPAPTTSAGTPSAKRAKESATAPPGAAFVTSAKSSLQGRSKERQGRTC
jgi:hypothetical protein